jgi:hypothetical protein
VGKFTDIYRQVSPALLLRLSAGYCQRALVGKLGMTGSQMGKYKRQVMVAEYGTSCAIPFSKQ